MAHHESRPPIVEEEAAHRALFLAGTSGRGCRSCTRRARARLPSEGWPGPGQQATIEVCSHHLLLDLDDLKRLGPFGSCAPALRDRALVEQMWGHVLDGSIDCLVSDHCAYTIEEKTRGFDDIFAAPNGCQVMQEMVPVVLDEAFHRRGMTLDAFARLISERPARIAGVYPRKGSLLVGSDADLVLWDLDGQRVVDPGNQQFSKNPWSPFEGRRIRARVVRTLLRGQTVYADGEIQVAPARPVPFGPRRLPAGRHGPTSLRLPVINPNSDRAVTEYLRAWDPAVSAHGLAASGARTSTRGGYEWPDRDVMSVLAGRPALTPSEPRTGL